MLPVDGFPVPIRRKKSATAHQRPPLLEIAAAGAPAIQCWHSLQLNYGVNVCTLMNELHQTARGFFATSRTRTAITVLVACAIIVFLCLHPPFVIKPLHPTASSGPAAISGASDNANSF